MESESIGSLYSRFACQHYGKGFEAGRAEGLREGRLEGRAEGLVEGRAEGRVEGRVQGGVKAVLSVLEVRGVPVSDVDRDRITACVNLNQFDNWMRRALTVASAADLFGDEPERSAG